jgi:hypothetical protein
MIGKTIKRMKKEVLWLNLLTMEKYFSHFEKKCVKDIRLWESMVYNILLVYHVNVKELEETTNFMK